MIKKIVFMVLALGITSAAAEDTTYNECMSKARTDPAQSRCINDSTKQMMQQLKVVYEDLAKNPSLVKWNGSNNMQKGNLREMYNNWLQYRDKFCSLVAISKRDLENTEAYNYAFCIRNVTEDHLTYMSLAKENIHTTIY